ncbi:MAG: sugar-binding protein, partial [Akkermansia sp.]
MEGSPFKTFSAILSENGETFTITERTPGRQDYAVAWWKTGLAWNMRKGDAEEALQTTSMRTELEPGVWQLVIQQSKNGNVSSHICEIYQTTDVGDLLLTRVDGYGADEALTTQYEYDQGGRLKTSTAPDGSQSFWTYDNNGRQLGSDEPWAESGRRITLYEYAHSSADAFNDDLKSKTVELRPLEGHVKTLMATDYTYTIANHIKRTEKRTTGLGVTGPRLGITEQWLSTAPNVHARGRTRMTQQINGVQTWYDYTATTAHGALYTETMETRVNGETVSGQSVRTITWITAKGQRVREEIHAFLTNGQWVPIDSSDYEFDTQNRWVKRTRGNGRMTQRALMCDGRTLWEIDEDGIRTDYAYNSARQQIEITRSAVMDASAVITPEIITAWTRDANGRVLTATTYAGAMQTTQTIAYDLLGRTVSSTDLLGRTTTWAYSANNLTTTQTLPSGATLITRSTSDGTIMEESGTGQRHTITFIDLANDGIRTYTKAIIGGMEVELHRTIANGIGEALRTGVPNTSGGIIFTRNTYNAKGQLIKAQTDAETSATTMAPTLWVYDTFGNKIKETWQLANNPDLSNSRITEWAYSMEQSENGSVYRVIVTTKNNGQGTTCTERQKQLISSLSATLERQIISTDPRGNDSIQWVEYGLNTERIQKTTVPTSTITAQSRSLDNFAVSQTDQAGITTSMARAYTSTGITYTTTDGRGNATTTQTDLSGRTVIVTDAAGNTTSTSYHPFLNQPSVITDALGKTTCSSYDIRGRKLAEWGTGIQPSLFTYDDADRMTALTTFRVGEEEMTTDPSGRTDGDTTRWTYDESSGLTVRKTYADGTHEDTSYNALNLKASLTDARGVVSTYTWNITKGVCSKIEFSDGTPAQDFTYNHLAMIIKVVDASGTRDITYNIYNEKEVDGITLNTTKHTVTEAFDNFGRSTGYVLGKDSTALDTIAYAYGAEGRISGSSFLHGGETKSFGYAYLPGTNLLESIVHPNGITTTRSYEAKRDLITGIHTAKGAEQLAHYGYSYDALGRPTNRTRSRGSETHNDSFAYNQRSELTGATLETTPYAYDYDNIGNRETAQE